MKKCYTIPKCIYLKKNKTNWAPVSKQTQSIRDTTNSKIRLLGAKYYNVKNLFDQLNLKKDLLFEVGRQLETEFRNIKKIDHLQSQSRRMKESIIVWYTEFFYEDVFQKNSIVLQRFLENVTQQNHSQNYVNDVAKAENSNQHIQLKENQKKHDVIYQSEKNNSEYILQNKESNNIYKNEIANDIKTDQTNANMIKCFNQKEQTLSNSDLLNEMIFNHEIDNYDSNNLANQQKETKIETQNNIFNYVQLLNF